MRKIFSYSFLLFVCLNLNAQQLPYVSQLSEAKSYWNPANTAIGTTMNLDVFVRQQWVSFKGAPTTGFINYQYPFLDQNMGVGASINFDKTGPLAKVGVNLNYAYKLIDALGEDSQLSLGITAGGQSYSLNTTNAVVNNPTDVLLGQKTSSGFFPSVGAGFYYISDNRGFKSDNSFFCGLAYNQLYQSKLVVGDLNQQRVSHIVFDLGTRIYNYDGYFEPSINVNYVNPEIMNLQLGAKYEMREKFWAGLGYGTTSDVNIQGGVILPNIGGKDGALRVGLLANLGLTSAFQDFGPGFEFFLRYEFDMD
jgi:type IX secretion system PorP/SprF family membrane protein